MATTARRLKVFMGVVMATAVVTGGVSPAPANARAAVAVRPTQELAMLIKTHKVVSTLGARPSRVGTIWASRPITGGRTVLPVIGHATRAGVRWLKIMVPGRPNGRKGWIVQRGTVSATTRWHVVVRTASRRVLVYRRGGLVGTFAAVVGAPSTPTPHGHFFVEESVEMLPGSQGGPFALALSGRSNVLQEFGGGPGQIGIHGVANLGGTPGTAVSHGCVRLADGPIRWLAARIAPGTPITISP